MSTQSPKLLFFELNEFNEALLEKAADELTLPSLKKALSLKKTAAFTKDTYDSDFLEPWVQWVSVHTGKDSKSHKVKHLGDIRLCAYPQIWKQLSDKGISSGVWGVLNGTREESTHNLFFFPDPWTFCEKATPQDLNDLLDLPRYMTRNYLHFSIFQFGLHLFRFLKRAADFWILRELISELPRMARAFFRFGPKAFVFFSPAEYLLSLKFFKLKNKMRPDFNVLFMNGIAHVQHYYWDKDKRLSPDEPIAYGLYYIDRTLEWAFKFLAPDEAFMMFNGLSQKNTNEEPEWNLYKLRDPWSFFSKCGLKNFKCEPLMTYDGHIFLENPNDTAIVSDLLKSLKIKGKELFLIEDYAEDPGHIFYRVCFYDNVEVFESIRSSKLDFSLGFYDHFEQIVVRTGKHIPVATLYSDLQNVPSRIENHEIPNLIRQHFGLDPLPAQENTLIEEKAMANTATRPYSNL